MCDGMHLGGFLLPCGLVGGDIFYLWVHFLFFFCFSFMVRN